MENAESKNALVPHEAASQLMLQAAAETNSFGKLLKFTKGKYFTGDDEVAAGREMIAHVTQWARGWVKFVDSKPVEQRIGKVIEGFTMPAREDLGDNDEKKWEKDASGERRDPWARQFYLPMEDPETGEVLVFVTGSDGGCRAINTLCTRAARQLVKGPPIIKLGVSSYKHKTYGRIETPDFPIVSWAGLGGSSPIPNTTAVELDDEIPFNV